MYVCFWPEAEICFALSHAEMTTYNTLGKSGQRAPYGSFILCASFFGRTPTSTPKSWLSPSAKWRQRA
jgi:hypothetical protein